MGIHVPANVFVADTVALMVRLENQGLGPKARKLFQRVELGEAFLHISPISLMEIQISFEKGRTTVSPADVMRYIDDFPAIRETPFTNAIALSAARITDLPELYDRIIAGTALELRVPVVTRDREMQASKFIRTVW